VSRIVVASFFNHRNDQSEAIVADNDARSHTFLNAVATTTVTMRGQDMLSCPNYIEGTAQKKIQAILPEQETQYSDFTKR
jgi:hypothetical protein